VRKFAVLIMLFVLGSFTLANAQDLAGMFNISPFAGLGMPMGDMADDDMENENALYRKMGFKFGAAAEYFFTPNIGAGIDFMYAIFGAKDVDDFESDDKLHSMNLGVHGKYVFMTEGKLRPYGTIGLGMTMNKMKDLVDEEEEEYEMKVGSKLYLMGGVGVMYFVSDMISVFGEFGFDYLMLDGAKLEVDDVEVGESEANYYFLDLKAGVNVWFGGTE